MSVIEALKAQNQKLKDQLKLEQFGGARERSKSKLELERVHESVVGSKAVSLTELRKMEGLMQEVEAKVQAYGCDLSSSSESEGACSKDRGKLLRGRKSHRVKSGQVAKVCHSVKTRLIWPHSKLRYQLLMKI